MQLRALRIIFLCLCLHQVAGDAREESPHAGSYSEVTLNGKVYFLNTYGFSLNDSVQFCRRFKNMELISLDEPNEFTAWSEYIAGLGLSQFMFWSSAWKDAGSSQWRWNSTGQNFDDALTYWSPGEPSTVVDARGCMAFSTDLQWEDWGERDCMNYRITFYTICE